MPQVTKEMRQRKLTIVGRRQEQIRQRLEQPNLPQEVRTALEKALATGERLTVLNKFLLTKPEPSLPRPMKEIRQDEIRILTSLQKGLERKLATPNLSPETKAKLEKAHATMQKAVNLNKLLLTKPESSETGKP